MNERNENTHGQRQTLNGATPTQQQEPSKKKTGRSWLWMILGALVLLVILIAAVIATSSTDTSNHKADHTITYKVTGASTVNITYATDAKDPTVVTVQKNVTKLPWSKTITVKHVTTSTIEGMSVDVLNKRDGTVSCEVDVDGKIASTSSVTGQDADVSCYAAH